MLLLLPPSETKTRPAADAPRLDVAAMARPELEEPRRTMLRAVVRTATSADAAARLGVPASSPELVDRMAGIEDEPTGPPLSVYAGVLYDQLDPAVHPDPERRVLVQSALFGVVDATADRIPAYRVSAGSALHRLGRAGTWWKRRLDPVARELTAETAASSSPLVIDTRSGAYRSMMPLRSAGGVRVLDVAPVQERGGVRRVVSHDAKRYRGWVVRVLLDAPSAATTADEAVGQLRRGFAGTLGVELDGDRLVIVDRADV